VQADGFRFWLVREPWGTFSRRGGGSGWKRFRPFAGSLPEYDTYKDRGELLERWNEPRDALAYFRGEA